MSAWHINRYLWVPETDSELNNQFYKSQPNREGTNLKWNVFFKFTKNDITSLVSILQYIPTNTPTIHLHYGVAFVVSYRLNYLHSSRLIHWYWINIRLPEFYCWSNPEIRRLIIGSNQVWKLLVWWLEYSSYDWIWQGSLDMMSRALAVGLFNMKMPFYKYRRFYSWDKVLPQTHYLHNCIVKTDKIISSLFWIKAQAQRDMNTQRPCWHIIQPQSHWFHFYDHTQSEEFLMGTGRAEVEYIIWVHQYRMCLLCDTVCEKFGHICSLGLVSVNSRKI